MAYYSVIFEFSLNARQILDVNRVNLDCIIKAYLNGDNNIVIAGDSYLIGHPNRFKIYTHDREFVPIYKNLLKMIYRDNRDAEARKYLLLSKVGSPILSEDFFNTYSKDITNNEVGNNKFGQLKEEKVIAAAEKGPVFYIDKSIIEEIRKLPTTTFDFNRLVRLLEELNDNYDSENYYSVAFLLRAIIDHVPPVFSKNNFAEVANQYSFKKSNKNLVAKLENVGRDVSDRELHLQIKNKEVLLTDGEIDHKASLAALLREIIHIS
jgi:hypothetical protein